MDFSHLQKNVVCRINGLKSQTQYNDCFCLIVSDRINTTSTSSPDKENKGAGANDRFQVLLLQNPLEESGPTNDEIKSNETMNSTMNKKPKDNVIDLNEFLKSNKGNSSLGNQYNKHKLKNENNIEMNKIHHLHIKSKNLFAVARIGPSMVHGLGLFSMRKFSVGDCILKDLTLFECGGANDFWQRESNMCILNIMNKYSQLSTRCKELYNQLYYHDSNKTSEENKSTFGLQYTNDRNAQRSKLSTFNSLYQHNLNSGLFENTQTSLNKLMKQESFKARYLSPDLSNDGSRKNKNKKTKNKKKKNKFNFNEWLAALSIFRTNSYYLDKINVICSRLNHSCKPNVCITTEAIDSPKSNIDNETLYSINPLSNSLANTIAQSKINTKNKDNVLCKIIAIKDININDEIFVSYLKRDESLYKYQQLRRLELQKHFDFICECPRCDIGSYLPNVTKLNKTRLKMTQYNDDARNFICQECLKNGNKNGQICWNEHNPRFFNKCTVCKRMANVNDQKSFMKTEKALSVYLLEGDINSNTIKMGIANKMKMKANGENKNDNNGDDESKDESKLDDNMVKMVNDAQKYLGNHYLLVALYHRLSQMNLKLKWLKLRYEKMVDIYGDPNACLLRAAQDYYRFIPLLIENKELISGYSEEEEDEQDSKSDVKISDEQKQYNTLTNGLKKHISSMQDALSIC